MKRSFIIAGLLAAATVAWVASGQIGQGKNSKDGVKPPADLASIARVPAVRVRRHQAELRTSEIVVRGRVEARRKVMVKAEAMGRIIELAVDKGDRVKAGDVLARLSPEDRPAKLKEAKALRAQRALEYQAGRRLNQKGFRSETQMAAAKAALEAAEAALVRAQMAVDDTAITAPFDGVVEARIAELGAFVERGDPVARVLDLDPILAVVMISERDVGRISLGGPGHARLITGRKFDGQIRFIAAEAEPETRTFRVEVELQNPDGLVLDGMTTELRLPLEQIRAHRVSPAILSLSDDGEIGVKVLSPENLVRFHPVRIIGDGPDGVWLTGLPDRVTLITVGHEFITEGQSVRPIDAETLAPLSRALNPDGAS